MNKGHQGPRIYNLFPTPLHEGPSNPGRKRLRLDPRSLRIFLAK